MQYTANSVTYSFKMPKIV